MAIVTIETLEPLNVDFGVTGTEAKIQTAKFLLATTLGSVPLAREIGWSTALDEPIDQATALNTARITTLLQDNIEGLTVEQVTSSIDAIIGKVKHKVVIIIDESI